MVLSSVDILDSGSACFLIVSDSEDVWKSSESVGFARLNFLKMWSFLVSDVPMKKRILSRFEIFRRSRFKVCLMGSWREFLFWLFF